MKRTYAVALVLTIALALCQIATPAMAQDMCSNAPSINLRVGMWVRVTNDPATANNLRTEPRLTAEVIDQMGTHRRSEIVGGPRCANGLRWWQVRFEGLVGWTADGQGSERWLEALPADMQTRIDAAATLVPQQSQTPVPTGTQDINCWNAPDNPSLVNGGYAMPNSLDTEPNVLYESNELTSNGVLIRNGTILTITSDPVCRGGRRWYQVRTEYGQTGWITDGEGNRRFYLRFVPA